METATRKMTGFAVICPFCNDPDSTVKLDLNDLSACTCTNCDEEFSPADAVAKLAEMMAAWEKVARWVEMAPDAE